MKKLMRKHPLISFFAMAYLFSWITVTPFVLSQWGILPNMFQWTFWINPFMGPTLSAIIMTGILDGKKGIIHLLRRLLLWRVGWQWYLFVLLGIPAICLLGTIIMPGALASFKGLPSNFLMSYIISYILILVLGGPLGEEIGWRGFALPRLQPLYGPLKGTIILGIMWTFWHFPHFFTSAQKGGPGMTFVSLITQLCIFLIMVLSMSIIFTWVFNHTKGSLLIAVLLHTSIDAYSGIQALFPAPSVTNTDISVVISIFVPALLILLLTKGKLGYQYYKPG